MARRPELEPFHSPGERKDLPWRVEISIHTSAKMGETKPGRRREYFPNKGKAAARCSEIKDMILAASSEAGALTLEQRFEAFRCFLVAKEYGFTLSEAVEEKRKKVAQGRASIPVEKLFEEFKAYKIEKGRSVDYIKDIDTRLGRFSVDHKEVLVSELTAEGIGAWIDGLKLESKVSWNNERRLISVLLNYAARHQPAYVAENVLTRLEEKEVEDKEVEIFPLPHVKAMLETAAAHDKLLLPALAIGFFAGVRPDEVRRLTWSEIHWSEEGQVGHIEVKAKKSKTARRRLIEIQPVLSAWLKPYQEQTGQIWPRGKRVYYEHLRQVREQAGEVPMVDDGFRHTFASCHLAKFNDIGALTNQLGHKTSDMLFEHYRRVIRKTDAETFFNLFPATV